MHSAAAVSEFAPSSGRNDHALSFFFPLEKARAELGPPSSKDHTLSMVHQCSQVYPELGKEVHLIRGHHERLELGNATFVRARPRTSSLEASRSRVVGVASRLLGVASPINICYTYSRPYTVCYTVNNVAQQYVALRC
jgi:hypothetical protein